MKNYTNEVDAVADEYEKNVNKNWLKEVLTLLLLIICFKLDRVLPQNPKKM